MTLSTLTDSVVYTGNGSTTSFPVDFKVLDVSHLVVKRLVAATGAVDHIYVGTEFSYSGLGADAGTLTLSGPALTSTYKLSIKRVVPYTQNLDLVNAGGFYPETVEEQLDRMVMMTQQIAEQSNDVSSRALMVPIGETVVNLPSAALRAGKFLGFGGGGDPVALTGTGSDSNLRTDLAASSGSALVGYTSSGTSPTQRSVAARLREQYVSFADFGADGSGSLASAAANVAKIRAALAAAQENRLPLYIPSGRFYADYSDAALLTVTKSIEMFGDGPFNSMIALKATSSNAQDIIHVKPPASGHAANFVAGTGGIDNEGYSFRDFGLTSENEPLRDVYPYPSMPGRHGFHVDVSATDSWIAQLSLDRLFVGAFSGVGFYGNNNNGGSPANLDGILDAYIYRCYIKNGIVGDYWGDTINIIGCVMAGEGTGVVSTQVQGATTLNISGCNIVNRGGGMKINSGFRVNINNNIVEMWASHTVGSNGAMIDLSGSVATIAGGSVIGNIVNFVASGGVPFASNMDGIRVDHAGGIYIESNDFNTPASGTNYGIRTTSNAFHTYIGLANNVASGAGTLTNTSAASGGADPFPIWATRTINAIPDPTVFTQLAPGWLGADGVAARYMLVYGVTYAALTAALTSPQVGMQATVTDSNTAVWGATIAGSGSNKVLAFYNGTNWTVAGK